MGQIEIAAGRVSASGEGRNKRLVFALVETITIPIARIVRTLKYAGYEGTRNAADFAIIHFHDPSQATLVEYIVNESYAALKARVKREHHAWQAPTPHDTADPEDA